MLVVLAFSFHGWRLGAEKGRKGERSARNVRLRGSDVDAIRESAEQEQSGALFAVGRARAVQVVLRGVVLVRDVGCVGDWHRDGVLGVLWLIVVVVLVVVCLSQPVRVHAIW